MEDEDIDGITGQGASDRSAGPAPFAAPRTPQQWHVHRVQLVECTEHFVLDYARSLRRRGVSRARIRQFHAWRQLMARAFDSYLESLEGPELMELFDRMLDHAQSIEAAAGMRFPAKGG